MPTVYDLLPDEVKQAYPPELLNDRARRALTMPLPAGYPQDRAVALAAKVAPMIPKLGRGFGTAPIAPVDLPAMPNGNPFVESRGGGASWTEDPLASPDAVAHFRSANPVVRAIAKAGEAATPFAAGAVNKLGALGNAVVTARTGVDAPMPQVDPAGTRLPATKGFAEETGALAGGIAGFAGETAALTPFVGPTAALGLTAATPETTWKGAAVSAATTMMAGKAAGVATEQIAPLLSAWKAAGVPGKIAAYVVSHMPGSAAFGALQPGMQAEVLRMTGENVPDPSFRESLASSAKLLAATLVTGIPGAMAEPGAPAPPSPELMAALEHVRGGGMETRQAINASLGRVTPEAMAAARPAADGMADQIAGRKPGVAPNSLENPVPAVTPATQESGLVPREGIGAVYRGTPPLDVEAKDLEGRIAALDANRPNRSDKRFKRWEQRRVDLQAQHDGLLARGATPTPRSAVVPEPAPEAPVADVAQPVEPAAAAPPPSVRANPPAPAAAAPIVDLFHPAGAEAEASGARSEPAPAANVEAPATPEPLVKGFADTHRAAMEVDGKVYVGDPGEAHIDVVNRHRAVFDKLGDGDWKGRVRSGFVDVKTGKFLDSDEAGGIGLMDAEQLDQESVDYTNRLHREQSERPGAAPLEQGTLAGMPAQEAGARSVGVATPEGNDAVALMGGEAKGFRDTLRNLLADPKNADETPAAMVARAERDSGEKRPADFDMARDLSSILRESLEQAGQGDLLAGTSEPSAPEPAPKSAMEQKFKVGEPVRIPQQGKGKAARETGTVTAVRIDDEGKPVYTVTVRRGVGGKIVTSKATGRAYETKDSYSHHDLPESDLFKRKRTDRIPLTEQFKGFTKALRERVGGDPAKAEAELRKAREELARFVKAGPPADPDARAKALRQRNKMEKQVAIAEQVAHEAGVAPAPVTEKTGYEGVIQAASERGAVDAHAAKTMVDDFEFSDPADLGRLTGLFSDGEAADLPTLRSTWNHLGQGIHVVEQARALMGEDATPEGLAPHRDLITKASAIEGALEEFDGTNAADVGEQIHDIMYPNSPEAIDRAQSAGINESRIPGTARQPVPRPTRRGGLPVAPAVRGIPADASNLPRAELPEGYKPIGDMSILERIRGGGKTFAENIEGAMNEVVALANPLHLATQTDAGKSGVDAFMEEKGRMESRWYKTNHTQRALEKFWDTVPKESVMAFWDGIQHGNLNDPIMDPIARAYRDRLNAAISEVQKFKNGAAFIENFFPQMWKDDKAAGKFMQGRRTGEGNRSFLKKRFYEDKRAGMDAGLEPRTWNPETEMQLYEHNIAKFIMYQRFLARTGSENKLFEGKPGTGVLHFNPVGADMPDGHAKLNPRWAQVYLNPELPVSEYVDKAVHGALQQSIRAIGAVAERRMKIGGQRLGYSEAAPGSAGRIVTKSATPLDVMAHELGHAVDSKYGMRDSFIRNSSPAEKKELRALADMRWEGEEPDAAYKKYVRKGEEKMAVLFQAYVHMPDRMKQVAPLNYAKLVRFMSAHPELHAVRDVQRSMVHEELNSSVRAPGMIVGGYYSAPEGLARILNNHESRDFITGNRWGRGAMATKNNLTMLELGLSGFHFTGVTLLAGMNMMATGMGDILRGEVGMGVGKMGRSMIPGASAAEYARAGYRMLATESPVLDAWFRGGGSLQVNPEYKVGAIDKVIKNTAIARSGEMAPSKRLLAGASALAHTPLAVVNAPMRLLTDFYIPQVKLGAFADELSTEMARRAKDLASGKITQTELERRVMANIDDRFGMLNYDNLFMHRTLKSSLMLLTRAYGWSHGTQRALGGAAFIDLPRAIKDAGTGKVPDFTPRMRFALAMTFQTMAFGGLYHWAHTGRPPKKLEDYLEPENGALDAAGHTIRVTLPTYMKDVRGWTTDPIKTEFGRISGGRGMSTIGHGGKLSSLVTDVTDFMENQTYRGPMRNPKDPAYKQAEDVIRYYVGKHTPFAIQNANKMQGKATREEKSESFFGITRAPVRKESRGGAGASTTKAVPYHRPSYYYRQAAGGSK